MDCLRAEGRLPLELELLLRKFSTVALKKIRKDKISWALLEETVGEWDSDECLFHLDEEYEIDLGNFETNPISGKGAVVSYRVTAGSGEDMEEWDEEVLNLEFRLYLIDENEEEKEVNLDLGYWEVKELDVEEFFLKGMAQFTWIDHETKMEYMFKLHGSSSVDKI